MAQVQPQTLTYQIVFTHKGGFGRVEIEAPSLVEASKKLRAQFKKVRISFVLAKSVQA